MQAITGEKLAICQRVHKEIFKVLFDKMKYDMIDRKVYFEWCNAGTYLGQCILRRDSDMAVVRISKAFDFSTDTVAHEILHALLPFKEKHGSIFQKATATVNKELGLNVTTVGTAELCATCEKPSVPYKYAIINADTGKLMYRSKRITKAIKKMQMVRGHDGRLAI